jgi:hypothetical protein
LNGHFEFHENNIKKDFRTMIKVMKDYINDITKKCTLAKTSSNN